MIDQKEMERKINLQESFEGVTIGDVDFNGQRIDRQFVVKGAIFEGTVTFNGTRFAKSVDFRGSKFIGKATFQSAHFEDKADFARTDFQEEATFDGVLFAKHVTFGATIFHKTASFENAQFQGETYFGYTRFSAEVKFSYSRFFERTFFDGEEKNRVFPDTHPSWMISVVFQKPKDTLFRIVNLSKCSLINTDLSSVELTDIKWTVSWRRKVIFDEISEDPNKNYPLIEKVYRQLKKNYEDRGSYGEGGDFHYGEMEMRRLSQRGIFKYVSLTALYKYLSGYGEKYRTALFWLCLFLFLFAGSYLLTGIKLQTKDTQVAKVLLYDITFQPNTLFTSSFWEDYVCSLLHTFEVATFQRDRPFTPISTGGRFLEILQTILVSAQGAFTALAIRRKFKR